MNKISTIDLMHQKMHKVSAWEVLKGNSESYSREEFLKDLTKLRAEYKRRRGEYEKFNNEVIKALNLSSGTYKLKGFNFDLSNETMIQQNKLRTTQKRTGKDKAKKGEFTEERMSIDFKKASNSQILEVFNSLEDTMMEHEDGSISTLSGSGGIYMRQAEFLNRFLSNDEQIKISERRLTRDTNKGIRTDIINAYKKIQSRLDNPQDIRKINDFWDSYKSFKSRVWNDLNLDYTAGSEEGRKLLLDFTKAYMKAGFNIDLVSETYRKAFDDGKIKSMSDIGILESLITRLDSVNNKIDETLDESKQSTNSQVEESSTSNLEVVVAETQDDEAKEREKLIKQQAKIIKEQQKQIKSMEKQMKSMEAKMDAIISLLATNKELSISDIQNENASAVTSQKTRKKTQSAKTQSTKKKSQEETSGIQEGFKLDWIK